MLETLRREILFPKFSKCEFWLREVQFLGHHMGILVDLAKIEVVMQREVLRSPTEIQVFSKIVVPLTRLIMNSVAFRWGPEQQAAFESLRQRLCEAPILTLQEGVDDFIVYCDSSITIMGAVLMQRGHVVAYAFR